MASGDISDTFKGLKINETQDINILLLGETGVGKSTFINSIANYLHFKNFKKASKAQELLTLIPSVITVTNENFEQVTITIGSDNNEYQEIGAAGTQDVKTYVFPIGQAKTRLRLIDSPGVGDPRGIEQDDVNCENILAYLSQLQELHAICFLLKPTTTRKTILFEYCVKQILSRLEKSASKNIIFIFTNTRGTNYSPGDTLPCLKTIIDEIKSKPPHVDIPLKANVFSLDNEAFRFLVAMKKNIKFNDDVKQRFIESWSQSSKECWRLISYIIGDASQDPLKPHQLKNTISINEARRVVIQLSQPLADISQLIHDNIRILDRHKQNLKMEHQSLDELKKKLYIPIINLEVTQLTQPVTVCTSTKCADMVQVGEVRKWHYRQRCHDPCYLTNVTREIIGDANLCNCAAMSGRVCTKCTCDFRVHMHIYYMTKTVDDKLVDSVVQNRIYVKEQAVAERHRLIGEIDRRKKELEEERETIIRSTAQFAYFLQHNAISPFNDSYKSYIEYLISRERSLGQNGDPEVIYNLENLLYRHEEIKAAFESSLNSNQHSGVTSTVTAKTVLDTIDQLYKLKHNGKKIRELIKKQKTSRKSEYDKNCEYVHPRSTDLSDAGGKKSKKDDKKDRKSDSGKKDKKKSGQSTDDERRNYDRRGRSRDDTVIARPRFDQNVRYQPAVPVREPPPPYSEHRYQDYRNYGQNQARTEDPQLTVRVELNQPGHGPRNDREPQNPYHGPPVYQQRGPPRDVYQNQQNSYQDPYNTNFSQGSYYPPPRNYYDDQRYGPQSQYYPPPPPNQHYPPPPPPNQHYTPPPPPPNQHYGPPRENNYGPPPQRSGNYQRPNAGYERQYNRNDHGNNRGRQNFGRGFHNNRGRSKSRSKGGRKSGNEKSNRSSSSDSSSD